MSIRDVTTIIKDGGGIPSLPRKKKEDEEEKVVAVIKDSDSPPLAGSVVKPTGGTGGSSTGTTASSTTSNTEPRQPTLLPASSTGSSPSGVREFTYDDYLRVSSASRAEKMLDEYFKTGNVSGLSTDTVKKLTDLGIRFSSGETAYTSPTRAIIKTDGVERKSWDDVNPLPRFGGEVAGGKGVTSRTTSNTGNTDPSSPNAPWRNPETFQALPEADYDSLSREDQKAYLKSGQNHALFVRQQKEAEAAERIRKENQAASDKMLADYFYNKLLKGDSFDLSTLTPKTREAIKKKAFEAYSNGEISKADYWDMSVRITKSLDNTESKVYNEVKDTTTNPLLKNSGFNRYANSPEVVFANKDAYSGSIDQHSDSSIYVDTSEDIQNIERIAREQNISTEHARIVYYSSKWEGHKDAKWTSADVAWWKTFGQKDFLFSQKNKFVSNYKDVIADAAAKYDIPVFLLAGIAHTEYGGDPMWGDDVMYALRGFDWSEIDLLENTPLTKPQEKTSFGNTSIQVRRALEMLNYDDTSANRRIVIDSLKDPVQNIYMAAKHLDVLRNVDFYGKSASELTDEEIQIIASRYNVGPECSIEIASQVSYGKSIFKNKDRILEALS